MGGEGEKGGDEREKRMGNKKEKRERLEERESNERGGKRDGG